MLIATIVAAVAGYAAAIFTWPKVRAWFNGLEVEISRLKARARQLEDHLRNKFGDR